MSLSPKHTTPFSVTDILSPIEEAYKKTTIEAAIPPLVSPYRNPSQHQSATSAMSSMGSMGGMSTNPYQHYVQPLSHHTPSFSSQYCNGGDLSHYGDPMSTRHSSASWYGPNATDPRLASKYDNEYLWHSWILSAISHSMQKRFPAHRWHCALLIRSNGHCNVVSNHL